MTVQELINGSLRLLGIIRHGESPSPEDSEAALEALNALIDEWLTQHRFVFVIDNKQYPLTSGKQTYSMGPGGDFDTERPVKIQSAGVIFYKTTADQLEGLRKPLVMVSSKHWAAQEEKSVTAKEPLKLYNDNDYPLTYLRLWPTPIC